jgi:hypothetical protein
MAAGQSGKIAARMRYGSSIDFVDEKSWKLEGAHFELH